MKKILFSLIFTLFCGKIFAQNVEVVLSALPAKLKAVYASKAPVGAKFISPAIQNTNEGGTYIFKWTKGKLNGGVIFVESSDGSFGYMSGSTENITGADVAALVPATIQQKMKQIIPKTQLNACTWARTVTFNGLKVYTATTKLDENTAISFQIVQPVKIVSNGFSLEITRENVLEKLSELIDVAQFEKRSNISETIAQKKQKITSFIASKNYVVSGKKITLSGSLYPTNGKEGTLNITFNADVKGQGNYNFNLFHNQEADESKTDK